MHGLTVVEELLSSAMKMRNRHCNAKNVNMLKYAIKKIAECLLGSIPVMQAIAIPLLAIFNIK